MDLWCKVLSFIIRYHFNLVLPIVCIVLFVLASIGDMSYIETIKYTTKATTKAVVCSFTPANTWDICASRSGVTYDQPSAQDTDALAAAQRALSLTKHLASTFEISTIASDVHEAHHNIFMFNLRASDPKLLNLSRHYIENSSLLQLDLQKLIVSTTVAVQDVDYHTSKLFRDLIRIHESSTGFWTLWRRRHPAAILSGIELKALHNMYVGYLDTLIQITRKQLDYHTRVFLAFGDLQVCVSTATTMTSMEEQLIAATIENRTASWLPFLLHRLFFDPILDEKVVNVTLLQQYVSEAHSKLGDARGGLDDIYVDLNL
ncbi:hypothetical protein MMC13_007583 [Lambiella insularis]|nr:hypothetical protein [Lambiella insularis]